MFSVNNFYNFFSSYYGWEKTSVMPWTFSPHGSKNLIDLKPYYDEKMYLDKSFEWPMHGTMIMHDQEPFSVNAIDTYRDTASDIKKINLCKPMNKKELLLSITATCSWPIFCHSEHNSLDIKYIRHSGLIDCHYFWHGLIARDWFRHWKHHGDLDHSHDWKQRFLLYARDHSGARQYRKDLIESLTPMQDQIQYNWHGHDVVDSSYSAKIVVQDAVNTAVHIVAETSFNQNKVHLTEKIFKPIVMRQPFVVFAGAGSLEYLRRYGFETFNSVWDESYDHETDHVLRANKITTLITDLYNQPIDQFNKIMQQCQSIVRHNLEHFFSDRFEKILLDELDHNIKHSISTQQQLELADPGGAFFAALDLVQRRNGVLDPDMHRYFKQIVSTIKQKQPNRFDKIYKKYPWAINF